MDYNGTHDGKNRVYVFLGYFILSFKVYFLKVCEKHMYIYVSNYLITLRVVAFCMTGDLYSQHPFC